MQPGRELEIGISDMTNSLSHQSDDLPDEMKESALNSKSNAQGMATESHEAGAEYLKRLDPTIVELAKRIMQEAVGIC